MPCIVWAEDSRNDQYLIACALADAGAFEAVFACDGVEAIRLAESARPALIVLDMKMPGPSGLETLYEIRKHPLLREAKVVLFSSSRRAEDVEQARALGGSYVQKPLEYEEFCSAVRAIAAQAGQTVDPKGLAPPPNRLSRLLALA